MALISIFRRPMLAVGARECRDQARRVKSAVPDGRGPSSVVEWAMRSVAESGSERSRQAVAEGSRIQVECEARGKS